MRVFFCANRNRSFDSITEYIESALRKVAEVSFTDNSAFLIPGRFRDAFGSLQSWDLERINRNIITQVKKFKPDIFFSAGGFRVSPHTVREIKKLGVTTVLWTMDAPINFGPIREAAPCYDFVFCGGSEAFEILKQDKIQNLFWLPFACDADVHRPVKLTDFRKRVLGADLVFVGTIDPQIYASRVQLLESLSDLDLKVWGPGARFLIPESKLRSHLQGGEIGPKRWREIYSAAKIVLCVHYHDLSGNIPCYQASPRVYEALACGAFLAVDAQKDVLALFKDRQHLAVYRDEKELREIISYYLAHPDERGRIAFAGRKQVLENYTYAHRINKIIDIVTRGAENG